LIVEFLIDGEKKKKEPNRHRGGRLKEKKEQCRGGKKKKKGNSFSKKLKKGWGIRGVNASKASTVSSNFFGAG